MFVYIFYDLMLTLAVIDNQLPVGPDGSWATSWASRRMAGFEKVVDNMSGTIHFDLLLLAQVQERAEEANALRDKESCKERAKFHEADKEQREQSRQSQQEDGKKLRDEMSKMSKQLTALANTIKAQIQGLDDRVQAQLKGLDERVQLQIKGLDERVQAQIKALDERMDAKIQASSSTFREWVEAQGRATEQRDERFMGVMNKLISRLG